MVELGAEDYEAGNRMFIVLQQTASIQRLFVAIFRHLLAFSRTMHPYDALFYSCKEK